MYVEAEGEVTVNDVGIRVLHNPLEVQEGGSSFIDVLNNALDFVREHDYLVGGLNRPQVKANDDAKRVGGPTEGVEELGVVGLVHMQQSSIGQDDI